MLREGLHCMTYTLEGLNTIWSAHNALLYCTVCLSIAKELEHRLERGERLALVTNPSM
jgi:hypothetical protein